ncbi:hypothetical protein BS47DRAFT_1399508 [Hydnum rufescens UP504]|uniref:Uncharacterized protein n=1 Tax=Hydnum rufescens UP504 TaxID=1448309 RepID=A0A9P6DPM4_9AGAM|nr:hypothetical protein BS47DRAFT_1399508 [Hydnum rufescens UP504]
MSVAVSRPPPQMPAFSRPQHVSTRPRAPPLAPGLIRLPMPVKESLHSRPPRPRQRRPAKLGPDSKGDLELKDDHRPKDTAHILKRSPTKDVGHRKPSSPVTTRRSSSVLPKSTTKTSQAETVFDLSDSDIPLPPKAHNKPSAMAPTTPKNEPNAKNEVDGSSKPSRSRRGGHQKAPSVLLQLQRPSPSPPVVVEAAAGRPLEIPSSHALSRSFPILSRRERPQPVPWLEAFEDDTVSSTVDQKTQSSPNAHAPSQQDIVRSSISVNPLMQKESPGPLDRSKDGNVVKYAGGRFQSAPAPTFLPMPSFQT